MDIPTCSVISDGMIPDHGVIVFDWDNTLKLYDKTDRKLSSRVSRDSLLQWKQQKSCEMYIISAIRPTKMNLETLLFEVNKLDLLDIFTSENDVIECVSGEYARKGSIVICGYDKAETFLKLRHAQSAFSGGASNVDTVDGSNPKHNEERVVFFDDEQVNIDNFSSIVKGSVCYLVK